MRCRHDHKGVVAAVLDGADVERGASKGRWPFAGLGQPVGVRLAFERPSPRREIGGIDRLAHETLRVHVRPCAPTRPLNFLSALSLSL